jgi:predicted nicotinamide N-methyase
MPDGQGGTSIGFGASVYDCSYILSSYIENTNIVYNKSAIEIGCGPGLTSIIAIIAGANRVICSDGD